MSETEKTPETEAATGAEEAAAEDTTSVEAAAPTTEETAEETAAAEAPAEAAAEAAPATDEAPAEDAAGEASDEAPAEDAAGEASDEAPAEAAASEASDEAAAEAAASGEAAPEADAGEDSAAEEAAAEDQPAAEAAAPEVHTFDELKGMTVVQMREIAEGMGDHDALHGYTTMHKEELIVALCTAQGIEAHEHHEVVGIDKAAVKAKIRDLKAQRQALIDAGDSKRLKVVRRRIRSLKRKIHKATV